MLCASAIRADVVDGLTADSLDRLDALCHIGGTWRVSFELKAGFGLTGRESALVRVCLC
jgi:hypothetical protein